MEKLDDLSIRFGYRGEVSLKDTQEILEKIGVVRDLVNKKRRTRPRTKGAGRR